MWFKSSLFALALTLAVTAEGLVKVEILALGME